MLAWTGVILLSLLALSVPVAAALGWLGLILDNFFSLMPLHLALGEIVWQNAVEYVLVAIPLFILLGEILLRAGIADAHVRAPWSNGCRWLPGGPDACQHRLLRHFCRVIQRLQRGYRGHRRHRRLSGESPDGATTRPLFLGSLAAGGTLGILIPPSINLIIYGLLTDTSVPQLYLAGFIPGLLLASLFMLTILVAVLIKPKWGGSPVETTWDKRWKSLPHLLPPLSIFVVVVGSIYAGIATPTEAASVGVVVASMILAACFGPVPSISNMLRRGGRRAPCAPPRWSC